MFRVLFDWREVERKGPNFHYLVRIIIIKKKEKKKKGNLERKASYGPHQFLIFSLQIHKKKYIPLESFSFLQNYFYILISNY